MIDHLFGRPNPSWKRAQVILVILFWLWRIAFRGPEPPRILWLRKINRLLKRFSPWQVIVSTLTFLYAVRNMDKLLGLNAPEPLARLYSPSYYRATWITTGLDAGFATAMSIRPKWLRDICSILFSVYYIIYANEADEKLRRFRAVPTVEMLRTTWEKTTHPLIRLVTRFPSLPIRRTILLPRPQTSNYNRPITAYLFSSLTERELRNATELILDFPGGGFVAMSPEHHEERLTSWAVRTRRPVLSLDYGKAPEYPYPYAIHESFDTYRILVETAGAIIGMSGTKLNIMISGDSAGATLAVNVVLSILEHNSRQTSHRTQIDLPVALVLNYAALDFNFTSWMSPDNLRVLRSEQSSGNLPGLRELVAQKDHLQHVSPLSMVGDHKLPRGKRLPRRSSWKDTLRGFTSGNEEESTFSAKGRRRTATGLRAPARRSAFLVPRSSTQEDGGTLADDDTDEEDFNLWKEEDRPIQARVRYVYPQTIPLTGSILERQQKALSAAVTEANKASEVTAQGKKKEPIGTRLTMTSRTGYFQDRIISPSMMRAMAILYIGPHRNPDFSTDYHLSPILAPSHMLAQFPPLLMQCGEKDPFVDDTVIFAGRVREAKLARKAELDLAISGKSARFGESLRMSATEANASEGGKLAAMKRERDKLAQESEDDWVQLVLFSDWSHGYLQMATLMTEAKAAIEELAHWINETFTKFTQEKLSTNEDNQKSNGSVRRHRIASPSPQRLAQSGGGGGNDTASPFTSENETDDSGITFMPRKYHQDRSSRPGSFDDDSDETRASLSASIVPSSTDTLHAGSDSTKEAIKELPDKVILDKEKDKEKVYAGAARHIGEKISEGELMRRRRLLDSDIF